MKLSKDCVMRHEEECQDEDPGKKTTRFLGF